MNVNHNLIFIAGFPRSGTTWFSNLINSSTKVVYRHEIIGRNSELFGDELFNSLKSNHGLDNKQYQQVMNIINMADVNTDKPPFFHNSGGLFGHPKIHYFCWLAAKAVPFLAKPYNQLFNLSGRKNYNILIKETRSTINLDSILKGLRAKKIIYLVRQPYGTIASHIKGESMGIMKRNTVESRSEWFTHIKEHPYSRSIELTFDQVTIMSSAEYYAIQWRIYHEDLVRFEKDFCESIFCFYDDFVDQPVEETKSLFRLISLQYNDKVARFIESSTGKISPPSILKDSNNNYYSVYRPKSYDKEAWRKVLSGDDIEKINQHTQSYYQELRDTFVAGKQ
jgi:hypothetical protein